MFEFLIVLLGIWVLAGALALSVLPNTGLRVGREWTSPENVFILLSDYVLGAWLLWATLAEESLLAVCLLLGALALSHLFRCSQVVLDMPRPYCRTKPLLLLNLGRMSLAFALFGACLTMR